MANVHIEKRVKEIIADHLGITESKVKPESTVDDLGADSLDTIEIIMALEDEYDLEISDEDAGKLTTVQDAIDYVGQFSR